jgi:hypothetical protein
MLAPSWYNIFEYHLLFCIGSQPLDIFLFDVSIQLYFSTLVNKHKHNHRLTAIANQIPLLNHIS